MNYLKIAKDILKPEIIGNNNPTRIPSDMIFRNLSDYTEIIEIFLKYKAASQQIEKEKEVALKNIEILEKEVTTVLNQTCMERTETLKTAKDLIAEGIRNDDIEKIAAGLKAIELIIKNPIRR